MALNTLNDLVFEINVDNNTRLGVYEGVHNGVVTIIELNNFLQTEEERAWVQERIDLLTPDSVHSMYGFWIGARIGGFGITIWEKNAFETR